MKKIVQLLMFGCIVLGASAQPNSQTMRICFSHRVGLDSLHLLRQTYRTLLGEPFTVRQFKYYLSNLTLVTPSGEKIQPEERIYLIDEQDAASKTIAITTAGKKFAYLEFDIGVDSFYNTSGVQTGVLDPLKGMFWTWNTGYVYWKLEGQSDSSANPNHLFSYHIGGYKTGENAVRKVRLPINASKEITNITVLVDVDRFFNAKNKVSISRSAICHRPGGFAMQLADNYAQLFSVLLY